MNRETLNIDDLLSNSFAAYEPALPAMAWEGIAARLDGDSKKRGFIWWKAAAMVAIIVGAWFAFRSIQQYKHHNHQGQSVQTEQPSKGSLNGEQPAQKQSNVTPQGSGSDNSIQAGHANQEGTNRNYNNSNAYQQNLGVEQKVPVSNENNTQGNISNPQTDVATSTEANANNARRNLVEMGPMGIRPFGIMPDEDWGKMLARNAESKELSSNGLPVLPTHKLGSRFLMGLSVGQIVSNTGYSVNSQYKDYVHKDFTKTMAQGEGILSSLSFSGSFAAKLGKSSNWYAFTGVTYYQRKNSLDFNFIQDAPETAFPNTPKDRFGRLKIKSYTGHGMQVKFKAINTYTQYDIPVGVLRIMDINKKWTFIPSAAMNVSFISSMTGKTLDYQYLTEQPIQTDWFRKTFVSTNVSAGIFRNLNNNFKLGVSASGAYMLTPMYIPGASIRPRAFTGGLSTQLIWRLY